MEDSQPAHSLSVLNPHWGLSHALGRRGPIIWCFHLSLRQHPSRMLCDRFSDLLGTDWVTGTRTCVPRWASRLCVCLGIIKEYILWIFAILGFFWERKSSPVISSAIVYYFYLGFPMPDHFWHPYFAIFNQIYAALLLAVPHRPLLSIAAICKWVHNRINRVSVGFGRLQQQQRSLWVHDNS